MSISVTVTEHDVNYADPAERQLFNIIQQINEQEPPHLLQGRFKLNGDVEELMAELSKAETEVGDAARRLIQIKSAIKTFLASK